jgi:hypothetical protein
VPVLGNAGLRPLQAVLTWAAWEKSLVYGYPPPTPTPHTAQSVLGRESEAACTDQLSALVDKTDKVIGW